MAWKADAKNRAFRYAYDKFGRLSSAVYLEEGVANQHYDEAFTYDKMGNVQSITRYGLQDNSQYGLIDDVSLYYIGNQVVHADDAVTDGPNYAGAFHFRDSNGTQWDTEYEYDKNGRLTRDRNKGILQIQYNLLNLPSKTTFSDGGSINYQYSASGMKQMVWGSAPGQGSKSQFYLGNYVYGNGVKQLLVDGGYVTFSGTTPQYHFYVKDHLGNNRMVVNANGTVEQVNHYYAFGGLMGENTGGDLQDFKYNGKELDRLHGLDWYDYKARHYDATLGRFPTIDPLFQKYYDVSPYAYCLNNPINAFDPDGKNPLIGFVIGAGIDYAAQVIGNVASGSTSLTEAFTHDIDMGSIVASGMAGAVSGGASSLKTIATTGKVLSTLAKAGTDEKGNLDVHVRGGKELATNAVGNMVGNKINKMLNKVPNPKIAHVTKSQAKAQLRAEGVKNGVINSKARSVAAMKNVRIDKANNKIDNVMESGKEMASKSIENTTDKLVKEWLEKEK